MQRKCDVCGRTYEAVRSTSKYCGSGCRARKSQQPAAVTALTSTELPSTGLAAVTAAELEAVGKLNTTIGQQAYALALRVEASFGDTGSSVAALHKQLDALMDKALANGVQAADPLDELKAWRDRRRISAG